MSFDTTFFKQLNILYCEDEPIIRDTLSDVLKELFNKVITAQDGKEGLQKYTIASKGRNKIDLIVTDINMPHMNGLEMIREIKATDPTMPTIITTAHGDSSFLLEAIELQVSKYQVKPVEPRKLLNSITEVMQPKHDEKIISKQKQEQENLLDIVNQIAMIIKTDLSQNITFVNAQVTQLFGYEEDELLGKHISILKHPDISQSYFNKIWDNIDEKNKIKEKIKTIDKQGNAHHCAMTFITVRDNITSQILEYSVIAYSITQDEQEKREIKKELIKNIQEHRKQDNLMQQQIQELEDKVEKLSSSSSSTIQEELGFLKEALQIEKKRSKKLLSQLNSTEQELKNTKQKYDKLQDAGAEAHYRDLFKEQLNTLSQNVNDYKQENAKLKHEVMFLQSKLTEKENVLQNMHS